MEKDSCHEVIFAEAERSVRVEIRNEGRLVIQEGKEIGGTVYSLVD